jgi:signal transduction histidine kinase
MGGEVNVNSVVKQWTTFTVKLPYEKPEGGVKKL